MPVSRATWDSQSRRKASRAPDLDESPPATPRVVLQKNNLPALAGTPASRRQYTYGSGVEPPPARPGRGLRNDQVIDLSTAVGKVFDRHEREDEETQRRRMPPPPKPDEEQEEDEDELAGDSHASQTGGSQAGDRAGTPRRSQRKKTASSVRAGSEDSFYDKNMFDRRRFAPIKPNTKQNQDDMRDDRSFGTESDYYGDATIVSSPRHTPSVAGADRLRMSTRASGRTAGRPNLRPPAQPSPLDAEDEPASPQKSKRRQVAKKSAKLQENENQHEDQRPEEPPQDGTESDASHQGGLADTRSRVEVTTPNGARLRAAPRRTPDILGSSKSPVRSQRRETTIQETENQRATSSLLASRGIVTPASFKVKPIRNRILSASKETLLPAKNFASNHSEADDAIQREIEASEASGTSEADDDDQGRSPWQGAWLRVKSFSPFRSNRSEIYEELDSSSEEEVDTSDLNEEQRAGSGSDWSQFFNLQAPLNALWIWITDFLGAIASLLSGARNFLTTPSPSRNTLFLVSATVIFLTLLTSRIDSTEAANGVTNIANSIGDSARSLVVVSALTIANLMGQLGDLASSISIPTIRRGNDLDNLWGFNEEDQHAFDDFLKRYTHDFKILRDTGQLHEASLEKLGKVVPRIVQMELKDGKPVVTPEFWHAIRSLLRADDEFLKVEQKKDGDLKLHPDHHWHAIAKRLASDPAFTSKVNLTLEGIEERMNTKMSSFWDGWVKDNDDKIASQLGTALEKLKSASSERELHDVVKKLVKDQLPDPDAKGVLVTRDEFLRHLKNEFAVHRTEIRAELNELQPKLDELVRESVKLATSKIVTPPSGMTRSDVTTLVNNLLRKALADVNLEAMARGKIHAHWDIELKNQVNYFNLGAGAVIDPRLSSATYDPHKKGVIGDKAYKKGIRDAKPLPATAALMPWFDEGDCWCAARQINHRGNPHGAALSVLLGHQIVPQHVVIEHILPGATIDPGARPREIEVHARIEDVTTRERLRDFAATHFPERDPSTEDWNATPADLGNKFVKIGQFTYEGAELHDGTHIHRLSSELLAMRAETDQVVVRATSNYGAENHTCFYRVRLFGHRLDVDAETSL